MSTLTALNEANRRFLDALRRRRPGDSAELDRRLLAPAGGAVAEMAGAGAGADPLAVTVAIETIVSEHRPVLFIKADGIDFDDLPPLAPEARDLIAALKADGDKVAGLLPLVGRIDVSGFAGGVDYLGTGWFIAEDIVVTNRHVAALIAQWNGRTFDFITGASGRPIAAALGTRHQKGDAGEEGARAFKVTEVLYVEPASGANDIAFLRVLRAPSGDGPKAVPLAAAEAAPDARVCTIGYPAEGDPSVIPNQTLMRHLYQSQYDVKRIAPGLALVSPDGSASHDCTTLGGCSGGLVLDPESGLCVGLHFAGIWRQRNLAVPVAALRDYVARRRWLAPAIIETGRSSPGTAGAMPAASMPAAASGTDTAWTIPLTITIGFGAPTMSAGTPVAVLAGGGAVTLDEAVAAFWRQRPADVVAVRAGFLDAGDAIGDVPCIAASVRPGRPLEAAGAATFMGYAVRYDTADRLEQVDSIIRPEAIGTIAYDDDARSGDEFSFETVIEPMRARLHVGPEYSWDELRTFLEGTGGHLVSAIYEFHGDHIRAAIEARLEAGIDVRIVMDNVTFSTGPVKDGDFDRGQVFDGWRRRFAGRFHAIVPREGAGGLVARAYHIKVSVRDDDTFWLSSGNWKRGSSQPIITDAMRNDATRKDATRKDLPGNREWHIVLASPTLARRFRAHIVRDFTRATELASTVVAEANPAERYVDIADAAQVSAVLERNPPACPLLPTPIERTSLIRSLLTPDARGAVYSEAVLDLIRSARRSLWFQIPYIAMASNPEDDRGYIDELIAALTDKLKRLPDARVILRTGGSGLSNPAHAAWHFKANGVDIAGRLRQIDNHHTKGMVVDGARVLIGSHNWSGEGVTLNRDASLIIHDDEVAGYYAEAFAVDWDRARPISPKKSVKAESVILPAAGATPPAGYRRVSLSELVSGDM